MSRHRSLLIFTLLLVLPAVLLSADVPPRDQETVHLKGEARKVADWLLSMQRAGWEEHDAQTYNTQWADDAKLIWGRSAEAGPHDHTTVGDQLRKSRALLMRAEPPGTRIVPTEIHVELEGKTATVDWVIRVGVPDEQYEALTAEHYELEKTDAGWKVKLNRAWVREITEDGVTTKMTEQEWALRDAAVKQAMRDARFREVPHLLVEAYRFGDAHKMAVALTNQPDATASDWATRGWAAGLACEADDIMLSFERARALDPDVWLPGYAKVEQAD